MSAPAIGSILLPGQHTQMGRQVDDIDTVVAEMSRRGMVLEQVDIPGLRTAGGIAGVAGNYPSAGSAGERGAWFRDSEGNLLGHRPGDPQARTR
jgi:hypothetical protein